MLSPAEVGYDIALYAQAWLDERLRLTNELAGRVTEKASPRAVHDLRVACRRLREAIVFFQGVPDVPPLSDVDRAARRLARAIGPLRELDVAVKRLTELKTAGSGKAERTRDELVAGLKARRRSTNRKRQKRIAKRATRLERAIAENLPLRIRPRSAEVDAAREAQLRAFVEARVAERRGDVENLFESLRRQGHKLDARRRAEQLHRIRVAVKHLRYTSEIARAVMPRVLYRPLAIRLRKLQELGGTSQDFTDLARILEKETARSGKSTRSASAVLAPVRTARARAAADFVEALATLLLSPQARDAG